MKFDTTVTLGHLLQVGAMIAAIFGAYSALDKRLTLLEYAVAQSEAIETRINAMETRVLTLELRSQPQARASRGSAN